MKDVRKRTGVLEQQTGGKLSFALSKYVIQNRIFPLIDLLMVTRTADRY